MNTKRVFILGAGFSKPAKMPLATELLPMLVEKLGLDEMQDWLNSMHKRLEWLTNNDPHADSFKLSIEEVFHFAHFDIEVHRLRQHLAPVGRDDGPGTSWNVVESIIAWLSYLERVLKDVIVEKQEQADDAPIQRWAKSCNSEDSVLTFNYDTLVERTLAEVGKEWNHGMECENETGVPVFKLHGSIDWIIAHRCQNPSKLDLIFDKENANQSEQNTGHVEDDYRLWRCRTKEQLRNWISGRDCQTVPEKASPSKVGIAGLGAYKQLHQVPGLGYVWARGMRSLYEADQAIVVGFSMSDFDAMAQMQFAETARRRMEDGRPLKICVVDPFVNEATKGRFQRVFRSVEFVEKHHEEVDWTSL